MRAPLLAPLLAAALVPAAAAVEVERGIPYAGSSSPDQTLDLFRPEADAPPPLVIVVVSRFWSDRVPERAIEVGIARPLRLSGAAVAVVRHRLAPDHPHPAQADDVAAAVAFLLARADAYGFDRQRVTLLGHGSGAHLASLVALDPRYLERHGAAPSALRGAVGISGVYDLESPDLELLEGPIAEAFGRSRRDASPLRHVRPDAPAFLLLMAQDDVPGFARGAVAFAEALREAGHPSAEAFVVTGRNHRSVLHLNDPTNPSGQHVRAFLGLELDDPEVAAMRELQLGAGRWREPSATTEAFHDGTRVETRPADDAFRAYAARSFREKGPFRGIEEFAAIDLFDWLDSRDPDEIGRGDWLVLTNLSGERSVWNLEQIRPYEPVLVVGIDGERNLFRITHAYRRRKQYSWRDDLPPPPTMARPLGAFLYFRKPPPEDAALPRVGRYQLTPGSFGRLERDPFAALADVPEAVRAVLTHENGCLYCHSFRGVGARAGHIRFRDATPHGGFAMPLEEYPAPVWRRFLFEQEAVASEVGSDPNPVAPEAVQPLHDTVAFERDGGRD